MAENIDPLPELWKAIARHRHGDGFWIAEILLETLKRETGFDGDKAALDALFGDPGEWDRRNAFQRDCDAPL